MTHDPSLDWLTLREVAERTRTPLSTVKRWAYRDRILPIEHVGLTRRVRVHVSVLVHFFPPKSVSFGIK